MRHLITTLVLLAVFVPGIARAQRKAPPRLSLSHTQDALYRTERRWTPRLRGGLGYDNQQDALEGERGPTTIYAAAGAVTASAQRNPSGLEVDESRLICSKFEVSQNI
jgi:hypothetical protein